MYLYLYYYYYLQTIAKLCLLMKSVKKYGVNISFQIRSDIYA